MELLEVGWLGVCGRGFIMSRRDMPLSLRAAADKGNTGGPEEVAAPLLLFTGSCRTTAIAPPPLLVGLSMHPNSTRFPPERLLAVALVPSWEEDTLLVDPDL